MIRSLLARGMGVGLAAALLAFAFSFLVGEPQVDQAIDLEARAAAATGVAEEPEVVGRAVQRTLGLATAVGMYGLAVGGLFGIAFAVAYGRIGGFGPRAAAGLLALGGFVALVALAYVALPGVDEVAAGFPPTLLWRFRLASLGTQAVLWTTLGLLFGALTERSLQDRRRQPAAAAP